MAAGETTEPPGRVDFASALAPSRSLRDIGRTSWYLVGILVLLTALVWLLGITSRIGVPVAAAVVVAAITSPIVAALTRRRIPRVAGAAIVLVGLVGAALLVFVIVIGGVTSQGAAIASQATKAADTASSWLTSVGVSQAGADSAKQGAESEVPKLIATLSKGAIHGIQGIASLAFELSLAALSLFFLLKDGPSMRRWIDGHLGVPRPIAATITGEVIRSLRGYFRGVTIVALFNAVVVGLGALVLGVPLAGTIAIVTFVTAYIPFIGAFAAGAFAVVIALGAKGATIALIMLVIVLLANGLLQNIVQPFAMGAALDLHPLAVLIVTIAAGCILGTFGLILAAPLTSAAVHVNRRLAGSRESPPLEAEGTTLPAVPAAESGA